MNPFKPLIAAAVVAISLLASPFAAAHATLKSSDPQAGAELASAPKQIALTFNEKIEEAFSTVTLADKEGRQMSTAKATVDGVNPAIVHLALPAVATGEYTVSWAVAGHDGHRRKGEFKFSVKN
jgi:methionine-rich copper-binding protein CopC